MFATVLHNLKSPENTGMLLRTHMAFGGGPFVTIGPEPWRFKKRCQAFSRKLEKLADIISFDNDDEFFHWCETQAFTPVAIEIAEAAVALPSFQFPERPALIVGHEAQGLTAAFLARCAHIVTIPQFGPIACLNVAVSGCIAIYEVNRHRKNQRSISDNAFVVANEEMPDWIETESEP